jgi:hypothetical protein
VAYLAAAFMVVDFMEAAIMEVITPDSMKQIILFLTAEENGQALSLRNGTLTFLHQHLQEEILTFHQEQIRGFPGEFLPELQ